MKFLDLLAMSVNNLRRRKLRTFLTVLGVVIGTASIVVMVSLGIGLKELNIEQMASYGSLTEITVYSNAMGGMDGKNEPNYMTDEVVEGFKKLDHVKSATPILDIDVIMKQGAYQGYVSLTGVSPEYMEQIPLKEGKHPLPDVQELQMVVGNQVPSQFYNPKSLNSSSGYMFYGGSTQQKTVHVDFMNKPMFVIFDTDAYYESQGGGEDENGNPVKPPKKYMIPTAGMVDPGKNEWSNYSYNVYVDLTMLKAQVKQIFKKDQIPGQPTNKKGKPYQYFIYDEAIVNVDDMANVTAVQKMISDMGFQANSNMEWLEQQQQQANMIQAVLGGIGAVSLFVAAIGIANTMMMSIYERTKEIGVIKVLGCDMGSIRNMFLLESGFIGFIGGVAGLGLSYSVSFLMNRFMTGGLFGNFGGMDGVAGNLSRIPTWLSVSSVVFAVFVGMAAGFFPSLRAMKLSPLAAIRNE